MDSNFNRRHRRLHYYHNYVLRNHRDKHKQERIWELVVILVEQL
jgi:hypothetical protein